MQVSFLQHNVQEELEATKASLDLAASTVLAKGHVAALPSAHFEEEVRAHLAHSAIAVRALDQHALDERTKLALDAVQVGLVLTGEEVEESTQRLDGGQVDLVHLVLDHHGEHVRATAPTPLLPLRVILPGPSLQQLDHLSGKPAQSRLPFQPISREEAGNKVPPKVLDPR